MRESKTIQTINKYYNTLKKVRTPPFEHTEEDIFCISYPEIELAKSIIQDYGTQVSKKLGKVLLGSLE